MASKKLRVWLIAGGTVVLLLAIFIIRYLAVPLVAEDNYSKRGSVAYYVTIKSATIKNFPLVKLVEPEEYYSSSGDGPKLPANGVIYLSNEDPNTLMDTAVSYLVGRGFDKDDSQCGNSECTFSKKGSTVELRITPHAGDTQQVKCTEYFDVGR